ncbi:hypothetical protein Kpho01_63840 [Kitasatospora phosalacinea]|uniref:Uncharacterized protein n=1 Tax=Kitasatospora phosalacinea TaxID=2065 RepID=A0A9W6PP12_9ACTN|nr:hypothetical protein Kpho01_63840 [Kitasatospora phosalacinea]
MAWQFVDAVLDGTGVGSQRLQPVGVAQQARHTVADEVDGRPVAAREERRDVGDQAGAAPAEPAEDRDRHPRGEHRIGRAALPDPSAALRVRAARPRAADGRRDCVAPRDDPMSTRRAMDRICLAKSSIERIWVIS